MATLALHDKIAHITILYEVFLNYWLYHASQANLIFMLPQ